MTRTTASALGLLLLSGAAMLPGVALAQDYGPRFGGSGDRYGSDAFERGYRLGRAEERRTRGTSGYDRDDSHRRGYGGDRGRGADDDREDESDD